ncbi:MAG: ACT domain-containing protein [Bdellovibrionota bacterium]
MLEDKYSHLKLSVIHGDYKYVLFKDLNDYIQASRTIIEQIKDQPYSIFCTTKEYSAIIPGELELNSLVVSEVNNWSCFQIVGEMPFGTVSGLIATITSALKESKIGVCVVSTYKTDLFFIKTQNLSLAISTLKDTGWDFL